MITFSGVPLFPGSVTRVLPEAVGQQLLPRRAMNMPGSGSVAIGPLEVAVTITGRMHAADATQLEAALELTRAAGSPPLTPSVLADEETERTWDDMSFVRFELTGPMEIGRVASVGFRARFVRIN
jgi:hypothetical protein